MPAFVTFLRVMSSISKRMLVFVHGAGGGAWEYDLWLPSFSEFDTYVVHLHPIELDYSRTTLQHYIEQITAVCEKHSFGRTPVLIGASMGAFLILKVASEYILCDGLILVCSAVPYFLLPEDEAIRDQVTFPAVVEWENGAYSATEAALYDSSDEIKQFAHSRWRNESGLVLNEMNITKIDIDIIRCPVLSVIPLADDTVKPESQEILANLLCADVLKFDGMSHCGPLLSRRAPEVAKACVDWIKEQAFYHS